MAMDKKERKELVAEAGLWMDEVLPASGKPEELVRLTTQIVQSTKRLLVDTPEDLRVRATATLSEFVVAARTIAKDPRSVDSAARQRLSNSRRAVESLVKELDAWHDARYRANNVSEDAEVVLTRLVSEAAPGALNNASRNSVGSSSGGGAGQVLGTSQEDGREKQLRDDLKKGQISLWKKTEPQQAPVQHGDPSVALTTVTEELQQAGRGLVDVASQRSPAATELLLPAVRLSKAVSTLLDLVDSLFVNRYPMRSQVHGFSCTLLEKCLTYGSGNKSEDVASLRVVTIEVPALLSAADVMITQCHKRAHDIVGSRKMSMQRSTDFMSLDSGSAGGKKRAPPPKPPAEKKEEAKFEIICVLCTNVAVHHETRKSMPKGTEVPLQAYPSTRVLDVRRMLSARTGIPRDNIEIKMQGDDVLPDHTRVKPNSPVPYFVFNTREPTEEELKEMKKLEKIKNRPQLEDIDWSQYSGSVAIALYDYEALGGENNLNFDEGDVIEILQKSPDGWWTGRIDDKTGEVPASFVEEIKIPQTKEERKRLAHRFRKKSPTEKHANSGFSEALVSGPSHQLSNEEKSSSLPKAFKKMISSPEGSSPLPKPKFDRKGSEPLIPFSQFESPQLSKRDKKKLGGIFKKRGGAVQGELIVEEKSGSNGGNLPRPRSPLLSSEWHLKAAVKSGSFNEGLLHNESPEFAKKPLVKPMASPKVSKRKPATAGLEAPRRPPPPIPNPPRISQRSFDTEDKLVSPGDKSSPDREREKEGRVEPTRPSSGHRSPDAPSESSREALKSASEEEWEEGVVKNSESMEELLKNLEEFDEVISSHNGLEVPETGRERDFATIPRSELPVKKQPPEISITSAENQARSQSSTPEMYRKPKPDLAPKPNLVQNGVSHGKKGPEAPASPVAPPRRKKGTRMSQKLKDKMGRFEATSPGKNQSLPAAAQPTANSPPPKPERDEKKRMKSRLEAMTERQVCSSAPVSRTVSPDIAENNLKKENSVSSEVLSSSSAVIGRRSLSVALKCIDFLSEEDRVADPKLFRPSSGGHKIVESWMSALEQGQEPDLSTLSEVATVTTLLRALLKDNSLSPLIPTHLAKSMCDLVKSTSPVSVLGTQFEHLPPPHQDLIKQLLRLFGQIINHSHKNHVEVPQLNQLFGPILFGSVPAPQSEPLLAYLISTCELILA